MRVSGLSGERTLRKRPGKVPSCGKASCCRNPLTIFAKLPIWFSGGTRTSGLAISSVRISPTGCRTIDQLAKMPQSMMTEADLLEFGAYLQKFRKITRVPIVQSAIQTADQIYAVMPSDVVAAITKDLKKQSFFTKSDIKKIFLRHLTDNQRREMASKIEGFVQAQLRHL